MKLLIVDHNAVRSSGRTLYRAIQSAGIADITVVAPVKWREFGLTFTFEEENSQLPVLPRDVLFSGKQHRVVYLGLSKFIRRLRPDVIMANAEPENHLAFQIDMIRRRVRPAPALILTTWRNIDPRISGFPYRFSLLHGRIERRVLGTVDHIVAYTTSASSIYRSYGFQDVTYIPPVVDTTVFAQARSASRSGRGMRIGFIGRLTFLKGGDLLLSALSRLPRDCRLTIVGDGDERQRWTSLANSLGVAERVEWIGGVPHARVPALMRQFDVLVLPSRTGLHWKEQFGRVLIEAMAAGVPVVGSDSGEIPYVIGDAGIVFPENDAEALARALTELYHDQSKRKELIMKGLRKAAAEYSIESVVPRYLDLLNAVARTRA